MTRLTPLQIQVLEILEGLEPQWQLFGGAALAGAYGSPRPTRDLDLLWSRLDQLGELPARICGGGERVPISILPILSMIFPYTLRADSTQYLYIATE